MPWLSIPLAQVARRKSKSSIKTPQLGPDKTPSPSISTSTPPPDSCSTPDGKSYFEYAKECNECQVKFGFRKYQYHCRQCYRSFCYSHCNSYRYLPKLRKKARICIQCHEQEMSDDGVLTTKHFQEVEQLLHEIQISPKMVFTMEDYVPNTPDLGNAFVLEDSIELLDEDLEDTETSEDEDTFLPTTTLTPFATVNESPPGPVQLKLISYNVWMMPDRVTKFARSVSPNKQDRALRIALELPSSDVVVFQEAFCPATRALLLTGMAQRGYVFRSPVVGRVQSGIRPLDGGVVLVSKHPILHAETRKFRGCCAGDDRLADKGILYVVICKDGERVHLFSTHTQAWNYAKACRIRNDQFRLVQQFIQEKKIPTNEPVIVAGDLNVDKWGGAPTLVMSNSSSSEDFDVDKALSEDQHSTMLQLLHCKEADYTQLSQNKYSFDGDENKLAAAGLSSDGATELLDYILYSSDHRQPTRAQTWISPLVATTSYTTRRKGKTLRLKDLSDHYPVVAEYEFN